MAITNGDIIIPKNSPSLIQYLYSGDKIFEFVNQRIKKTKLINNAHILTSLEFSAGQTP